MQVLLVSPLEVLIVTSTPIFDDAVQELLEREPGVFQPRIVPGADLAASPLSPAPDVALIAPQTWRELAHWLPELQEQVSSCPWLVMADLLVAGMFLSLLERQPCAILSPGAPAQELRATLSKLAQGRAWCPTDTLLMAFAAHPPPERCGWRECLPTPKELECGCAVALGLNNHEIAAALPMCEGTVKTHIHNLLQKLQLPSREALRAYFVRVLSSPLPFGLRRGREGAEEGRTRGGEEG